MTVVEFALEASAAKHFLVQTRSLRVRHSSGSWADQPAATPTPTGFRFSVDAARGGRLELDFAVRYRLQGRVHLLLLIRQTLDISSPGGPVTLTPRFWMRGAGDVALGRPVADPALHPLLALPPVAAASTSVAVIRLSLPFLDITDMFLAVHGGTAWFQTLGMLKATSFRLRVLAGLRGHPLIWYVAVPESALERTEVTPHVFYWPADYGGIDYPADSERGIVTRNHHRSMNTANAAIQSGGETLCYFLLTPLDDARFLALAPAFEKARERFEAARSHEDEQLPRPAYSFRRVLEYTPRGDARAINPQVWMVPFGLEQVIAGTDQVLFFPQVAGGDATHAIRPGLRRDLQSALAVLADREPAFRSAAPVADRLILSCYSQAGGNLFTASRNNSTDIRGVVAVEPQYVNERKKGESDHLALGKEVLPGLIRRGVKVAIVSRRREAWQRAKYLPRGVDPARLTLLPVDQTLLAYPQLPDRPQFRHRLSRLLDPAKDAAVIFYAAPANAPTDAKTRRRIAAVNGIITRQRARGLGDEALVTWAFRPELDADVSGGFSSHNFLLAGAEDDSAFDASGRLKTGSRPVGIYERAVRIVAAP
ncbi:hypothetical protein QSU92_08515 [Microbacterium sp. ET2]|uniref:hypothetical protein n=1 Tax=Microbacterium albipurpureum TaxID=3050384 RepID=UPI00259C6F7C|nr:hypothetical protein [Microbacterium sp. ET2 (Ac-2212)]WJL97183.1 hypothetical protein QSU92_08515 [Microbacterium sp. ET2 (Ac-2212)]